MTQPPAERFEVDGYFWQVFKNHIEPGYTALAKVVRFVSFAKPLNEPWDDDVWFAFGPTAAEAYTRLRESLGLVAKV